MEVNSKNVSKVYKIKKGLFRSYLVKVVENFNYSIKQGEIIGLIGGERSGKSTIVNLLSGKVAPSDGEILVDGENNRSKLRNSCEIISDFKKRKFIKNESVYNNLVRFGIKNKLSMVDIEKKISIYKDVFELEKIINKRIGELDNLSLIKVYLTISMLRGTSVLFFDSALSDLKVVERNVILKMLKRLNKEYKTTIFVSSNDFIDIEKICKRITIIDRGLIIKDGPFEDLRNVLCNNKEISITFNKSVAIPEGDFEILENSDYMIRIRIDFNRCDFASLINQFDIKTISDINIASVSLAEL